MPPGPSPVPPGPSPAPGRMSRRSSVSSLCNLSPVEPPEVDLSHLSEEERAQIAAVMVRARQMQEEETARLR